MSIRLIAICTALAMTVVISGCAQPKTKYAWGNYDDALHDHYKSGGASSDYQKALEATILEAGESPRPLAPGIYAEYCHLLMQQNRNAEAIDFFQREKADWPESTQFMDRMIKVAESAPPVKAATENNKATDQP